MVAITIPFSDSVSAVREKLLASYHWEESPVKWMNAEAIAEQIGVEKNRANFTMIGIEVRKLNARTRRTNGSRLIAVPRAKI